MTIVGSSDAPGGVPTVSQGGSQGAARESGSKDDADARARITDRLVARGWEEGEIIFHQAPGLH